MTNQVNLSLIPQITINTDGTCKILHDTYKITLHCKDKDLLPGSFEWERVAKKIMEIATESNLLPESGTKTKIDFAKKSVVSIKDGNSTQIQTATDLFQKFTLSSDYNQQLPITDHIRSLYEEQLKNPPINDDAKITCLGKNNKSDATITCLGDENSDEENIDNKTTHSDQSNFNFKVKLNGEKDSLKGKKASLKKQKNDDFLKTHAQSPEEEVKNHQKSMQSHIKNAIKDLEKNTDIGFETMDILMRIYQEESDEQNQQIGFHLYHPKNKNEQLFTEDLKIPEDRSYLREKDYHCFVLNRGHHWVGGMIDKENKKLYYFNSKQGTTNDDIIPGIDADNMKAIYCDFFNITENKIDPKNLINSYGDEEFIQKNDGYNCGIYVMNFIILMSQAIITKPDPLYTGQPYRNFIINGEKIPKRMFRKPEVTRESLIEKLKIYKKDLMKE